MTERFELRIGAGARADMEALYDYVRATRSRRDADSLLLHLLDKVEALETMPRRGAIPPEGASFAIGEIRQILVGPYRVIYRIVGRTVCVLLVADGRRDMRTVLQRRLLNG